MFSYFFRQTSEPAAEIVNPSTEHQTAEQHTVEQTTTEQTAAEQLTTEQTTTEQTAAEQTAEQHFDERIKTLQDQLVVMQHHQDKLQENLAIVAQNNVTLQRQFEKTFQHLQHSLVSIHCAVQAHALNANAHEQDMAPLWARTVLDELDDLRISVSHVQATIQNEQRQRFREHLLDVEELLQEYETKFAQQYASSDSDRCKKRKRTFNKSCD